MLKERVFPGSQEMSMGRVIAMVPRECGTLELSVALI